MASKSSRSSHASLVSIDPAVASQITSIKSTLQPMHTRTESTPVKSPGALAFAYARGHGRNNSAPSKQHKRSNSLRRAKNSTEMLRQRSAKKDTRGMSEASADSKRGRNFAVTNVGTGGMLYLRPTTHQRPMSPALSPAPITPWTAPATTLVMPLEKEAVLLSAEYNTLGPSLNTRTRSVSPKRLIQRINKSKEAQAQASRPTHVRSQSFSTVDESRRSIKGSMPQTLKIVINRTDQGRPKTSESGKPTLEIPIPHYRLGNPRFSSNGTPMLRSSSFTRASSTPSTRHASNVRGDAPLSAPPPSSMRAFAKLQNADHSIAAVIDSHAQLSPNNVDIPVQRASAVSSIGAAPSIYDELSEVYNDPSIVRFAHNVKEITAATPARIIAQISSESFMDYELVSDFFLTFRPYMSTLDVLDLLLARLKWAIGRMTDDGRIIRIRTFAALRHWILNYFMDDFVPSRYLRERFCDEVNDMYEDVKQQYMGVQSDLKILRDLKRCWNGRCSLYWDGEEFNMDADPDDEIYPGGVLGSRNPDYIDPSEVRSVPGQPAFYAPPPTTFLTAAKRVSPPTTRTVPISEQKPSYASSGPAESVQSEQSIQPNSCSVPLGVNRRVNEHQRSAKGPVPVSVLSRRQNAPAELTVATNIMNNQKFQHKRGGNSIDSTRERTPLEIPKSAVILPEPHEGSVIRGNVYGPVEPFVQLPTNLPQSPFGRFDTAVTSPSATGLQYDEHLGSGAPAVKNIFGSIRRALSGRPGNSEVALITVSTQSSSQSLGGRKISLPLNTTKSQDELRRRAMGGSTRANIRIDLLCAAAVESYQASQSIQRQPRPSEARTDIQNADTLFPSPPVHHGFDEDGRPSRILSHRSAESGSILIVNDTDSAIPAMSGAIQSPRRDSSQRTRSSAGHYVHDDNASFETQIAFQDDSQIEQAQQEALQGGKASVIDTTQNAQYRPVTPEHDRVLSDTASSTTMHRRNSLSSSVAPNRMLASPGATASVTTPPQDYHDEGTLPSPKGPIQLLRRRPGGDLRKNQNVHDMEIHQHHESVGSIANTFSTQTDSLAIIEQIAQAQQFSIQRAKQVSMIHTHSSQHLRPSFELAVAGFSDIPDDDDGGLEATLLKLEGKYEKSPELGGYSPEPTDVDRFSGAEYSSHRRQDEIPSSSPIAGREDTHQIVQDPAAQRRYQEEEMRLRDMPQSHLPQKHPVFGLQIQSLARSEASTESVPLLKRDLDEPHLMEAFTHQPRKTSENRPEVTPVLPSIGHPDTERGLSTGSYLTADNTNPSDQSLLKDDDDRSDLSSEISVDIINYSEALGNTHSPLLVAPGTAVSGLEIPSHPLAHSSFVNISLHPSLALDSKPTKMENYKASEPILLKIGAQDSTVVRGNDVQKNQIDLQRGSKISAGPAHVPFVLACDSQMLAQQLTLVEQSALTEIEWSDLVEMRWNNLPSNVLDWAEYVANQNVRGVDLVITRFNLMVKWALSEIVLTQNVEERVRVITKFIHVAAHARRLHNYATMLQLTIALTSTDSTRMTKTWDLVPGPDKSLLKNMEALIQPVRNFHDLRLEMESADLTDGCIPFIGLYIHDLTYNAQKPIEIDAGKGQPPLINFERFRTAAIIVKGLLRLIDASSKYDFDPIHGVVERCLWIAALPDERVRSLSRALQEST